MQFCNKDLELNKFIVKDNLIETDISKIKNQPLDRAVYFRPSNAPIINIADSQLGSCWAGYFIPTGNFIYSQDGDILSCTPVTRNVNLEFYTQQVHDQISRAISSIYQSHAQVTLCYSGGIDSMVLLSFVISQKLLPRTNILCFENRTQDSELSLHNNLENKHKVDALLNRLESQCKSITRMTMTVEDIAYSFNHGDLQHLKCYTTHSILRKHRDTAFIFGFHGNQILLHKPVFVDELLLQDQVTSAQVKDYLNSQTFYTQSLKSYDVYKPRIGIDRTHLLQKPWALMDGINGNKVYSPIGTDLTFDLLRRLDFTGVSLSHVANATIAQDIMFSNVDNFLEPYIGIESLYDNDMLKDTLIPLSLLDQQLLTIPDSLSHDAEGLDYIQDQIALAHTHGHIPINSLVAIKMLKWIDQL